MSDNELSTFLRARREGITPAEVGLPTGPRRRTPGLRRAELATLAGISVEYLTRLEQGRDRHPSPQVLGALAEALRLSPEDRIRLRFAAKAASGESMLSCPGSRPPAHEVRPTVQALLDRLEPTPAIVVNRIGDVIARTAGYERLAEPLGVLDTDPVNLVRFLFADPRARTAYPDWDRVADDRIALLRSSSPGHDPYLAELVDELSAAAGASFTDRMKAAPGLPNRTGVERLAHPEAGELRLAYESLEVDEYLMLVYLPADTATSTALDRLTGLHPRGLRVVTS